MIDADLSVDVPSLRHGLVFLSVWGLCKDDLPIISSIFSCPLLGNILPAVWWRILAFLLTYA